MYKYFHWPLRAQRRHCKVQMCLVSFEIEREKRHYGYPNLIPFRRHIKPNESRAPRELDAFEFQFFNSWRQSIVWMDKVAIQSENAFLVCSTISSRKPCRSVMAVTSVPSPSGKPCWYKDIQSIISSIDFLMSRCPGCLALARNLSAAVFIGQEQ